MRLELSNYLSDNQLLELLQQCCQSKVSDVCFQSSKPVFIKQQGRLFTLSERLLTVHEVKAICLKLYGSNVEAELARKGELDFRFDSGIDTHVVRVNITTAFGRNLDGVQISIRLNQNHPYTLDQLGVATKLSQQMISGRGLFLVSGPTGGGKTTLQAAMIRSRCQAADIGLKVLTYEAPIEYSFDQISGLNALICQTEIPRNLSSYSAAVRNALRRNPDLIMIGETRDQETLSAVLEAAYTGHDVITTIHASGVVDVFRRSLNFFHHADKHRVYCDLTQALSVIVWQKLVIDTSNQLLAVREYINFDHALKQKMLTLSPEDGIAYLNKVMQQRGCDIQSDVRKQVEMGNLSAQTLQEFGVTLDGKQKIRHSIDDKSTFEKQLNTMFNDNTVEQRCNA